MAQNKSSLIRYKTIDKCLQNRSSAWSLDDLINECSKALSKVENKDVIISKRSVQLDIQMMRSSENGYAAPIEVYDRKYYRYTDSDFSITNLSLTSHDKALIEECLDVITQYEGFSFYEQLQKGVEDLQLVLSGGRDSQGKRAEKFIIELDKSKKDKVLKNPLHKSQKVKREKKNGNVVLQFNIRNVEKFQKKVQLLGKAVRNIKTKNSLK